MLRRFSRAGAWLILSISALAQAAPKPAARPKDETTARAEAAPSIPNKKKRKKKRSPAGGTVQGARRKQRSEEPKQTSGTGFKSSAGFGYQHGLGVRRFDSPFIALRAEWSPWRAFGPLRLELPLEYQQHNILDADLNEFRGVAAFRGTLQLSRYFEPFASAELTGVWRPNWPDLYQPVPSGGLLSTDRFSYLQRAFRLGAQALLGRSTKARFAYTHSLWDYRADPAFDPVDSASHLPPSDHREHEIKLGVATTLGRIRPRLALALFQRDYFLLFARDRQTGLTHTAPGGPPPNPLYVVRGADAEVGVSVPLGRFTLGGSFGVQLVDDVFQGYYSSVAHHPSLSARWSPSKRWTVEIGVEVWLRRYGADSYAQGRRHPALLFGDRRVDRTSSFLLESRWKISPAWTLATTAKAMVRRTNFPPYDPGVFPANARYDIDWNYDNWQLFMAVEYRGRY